MKHKLTVFLSLIFCTLILTACADPKAFTDDERLSDNNKRSADSTVTYNFEDGAAEPPNSYNSFANSVTEFELKQFRNLCQSTDENFAFAPASSTLQTILLANAASQDMRQEILLALGGKLGLDDINGCASYFKSRMENVSRIGLSKDEPPESSVKLDGALLIDESIDVKTAFLQTAKDYIDYDIFRFDFDGENAGDKLKNYLKGFSENPEISLENGSVNLVSASAVTDKWLNGYAKEDIAEGVFHGADGDQTLSFMTSNETMIQSDTATGVIKYTADNPLKLMMIMPNDGTTLDEYINSFDAAELSTLLGSIDITKQSTAVIPACSVEAPKKASALSGMLSKSGLYSLFGTDASFSAMSYTGSGTVGEMYEILPDFRLSAAGVNSAQEASLSETTAVVKTDETVIFDRPFLFILADNESNIPVQMGVYQ